jgi:P pilus assembly chaperone PapD
MRFIILISLLLSSLYSITMTPLYATLESRKDRNIIFRVTNPTKEPVAVVMSVLELIDTNHNKEKRVETDKVSYYPSQFVLNPHETKNVRVRYMKKALPPKEEVFRIIAKELNIDLSDKMAKRLDNKIKAEVKMRFSYEGLLFVRQPDNKPKLSISKIKKSPNGVIVEIYNSGEASAIPNGELYNYIVTTINHKVYTLTKDDLKGAEFRRVLHGKSNQFLLKNISSIPISNIQTIQLEKK